LAKEFKRIANKSKYIGDVRTKGMMIAIEFVKDKNVSKEPNLDILAQVFEKGK